MVNRGQGVAINDSYLLSKLKEGQMKRQLLFFLLVALFVTSGSSVYAEETAQEKTVITVTPRVWFAFAEVVDESWYNAESIFIPMYGLTATVAPSFIPNWSFLLTGLYGTAKGDIKVTESPNYKGKAYYDRLDIEFLVRYTFPGTGLSLFIGPRYVNWKSEQKVRAWNNYKAKTKTDVWAGEVGASYVHTIGESGQHRLFSNLTLGIAYLDSDWSSNDPSERRVSNRDTEPMVDANVGYEYLFTKNWSASLRYRIFTMREENDYNQHRWRTFHGPEIGLSFRF
jgi:opacity protein-like surface antigen